MTIEEIKNEYAKEKGRDSWKKLVESYAICGEMLTSTFLKHENAVIQLIQDELKKKICMGKLIPLPFNSDYDDLEKEILNTENIK